jgi:hypothetical protein
LENVKCLEVVDKLTPEIMEAIDELVGKPKRDPDRQD